jgi:hypothetical protein
MNDNCLFCKIVAGQIPSRKAYEDDDFLAFHDINPAAPVHVLVIPKLHLDSLADCEGQHAELLGKMVGLAPRIAREQGVGLSSAPSRPRRSQALEAAIISPSSKQAARRSLSCDTCHGASGESNGQFQHLALVDRPRDRVARVRHEEAQEHG